MNVSELHKKMILADRQIVFVDKLILELKSEVGGIMSDYEKEELDGLYILKDQLAAEIIEAQENMYKESWK